MQSRCILAHLPLTAIIVAASLAVAQTPPVPETPATDTPVADTPPADAATDDAAPAGAAPLQAIWKDQEIDFNLVGYTSFYSCGGLEDRLRKILRELGLKAKIRVSAPGCGTGVVRFPRVVLHVSAPVEATPEALAEQEKGRSTRELSARVQGKQVDPETTMPFPAEWKAVSLSRGKLDIEPGDCELIDEIRRKVLPKLSVRVVKDDVQCSPNSVSLGQPRLEVEALVASPKPDDPADKAGKKKKE